MSRKQVKNHFAFVYSGRPESYNANNTRKNIYKKKISSTYNRFFTGKIDDGKDLYAIVYYFFREDLNLDADNISKPMWDALNDVGYSDDNQIKIRTAVSINLCKYDIIDFDQDNIPSEIAKDLFECLMESDHTLYIEVGTIDNYENIFNISNLWK